MLAAKRRQRSSNGAGHFQSHREGNGGGRRCFVMVIPARTNRLSAAGAVILVHVALLWLFLTPRVITFTEMSVQPVMATLLDQPRPRNLSIAPEPVTVNLEGVVHLQRLAPKIQDIPVEKPEPPVPATTPLPASAPLPEQASTGLNGEMLDSSGHSGGGLAVTLLARIIPKYPVASARRREEGATQVQLHVDTRGRVTGVRIIRSSGSPRLDDAAVDAFRKWRFAPLPPSMGPDGVSVTTEQRFILYRLRYSRLGDKAADSVDVEEVQGPADQVTPGSQQALRRFIDQVRAGTFSEDPDFAERIELGKMREALQEWGAVKSMHFTGTAGPQRWTAYRVRSTGASVEVKWNLFEVVHEHATTEWLIAVDRQGRVWCARTSRAPWT
jgi:periplasmic protein TonB